MGAMISTLELVAQISAYVLYPENDRISGRFLKTMILL